MIATGLTFSSFGTFPAAASDGESPPVLEPTAEALRLLDGAHATVIDVDRSGNLWWWNRASGALQAISPAGEVVTATNVGSAKAADFDPEWGVARLDPSGRQLLVEPLRDGAPGIEIALGEQAADVSWLGSRRVAVSPVRADHRVAIWDLEKREKIATWGDEEAIPPRIGTVRLNTFLLDYDFRRQLLYTLETYTGRIEVFDAEGRTVLTHQLPGRDRAELESWLAETDRKNRERGKTEEVSLHPWGAFTVDADGSLWILDRCLTDEEADSKVTESSLRSWRVPLEGEPDRRTLDLESSDCCSLTATLWGDRLILFRSPQNPMGPCTSWRKL
jgi:hypothetical protein